jgi:hypothetical protein
MQRVILDPSSWKKRLLHDSAEIGTDSVSCCQLGHALVPTNLVNVLLARKFLRVDAVEG